MEPIVLMVDANAGGVGKSTIARELSYLFSLSGKKTLLIDLDPSPSQHLLNGLAEVEEEDSVVKVLRKGFEGDWPLFQMHEMNGLDICLGSKELEDEVELLQARPRKEYVLQDILADCPSGHEIVVLDCPGSRTILNKIALAAATHVLIVVEPETKSANGLLGMVEWFGKVKRELRLRPAPKIVGVLPSKVNIEGSTQRRYMQDLKSLADSGDLGFPLFEGIPDSRYVVNSVEAGVPMRKYRSGWKHNQKFDAVIDAICENDKK